jgi:hypothetical protein
MSGDFSYMSRRAVPVIALLFSLAGCAAHRWSVCFDSEDAEYCRHGYTKHDAKVVAESFQSLGVATATARKTPETETDLQIKPQPKPDDRRPKKSGASDVLD